MSKKRYNYNDTEPENSVEDTIDTGAEVVMESPITADDSSIVEEVSDNDAAVNIEKEEEPMDHRNDGLQVHYVAGKTVKLNKTKVYPTSKSENASKILTGVYYITNGKLKDGRYRISSKRTTEPKYAVGYINKEDIK